MGIGWSLASITLLWTSSRHCIEHVSANVRCTPFSSRVRWCGTLATASNVAGRERSKTVVLGGGEQTKKKTKKETLPKRN
jgi:hypothetical protein